MIIIVLQFLLLTGNELTMVTLAHRDISPGMVTFAHRDTSPGRLGLGAHLCWRQKIPELGMETRREKYWR